MRTDCFKLFVNLVIGETNDFDTKTIEDFRTPCIVCKAIRREVLTAIKLYDEFCGWTIEISNKA